MINSILRTLAIPPPHKNTIFRSSPDQLDPQGKSENQSHKFPSIQRTQISSTSLQFEWNFEENQLFVHIIKKLVKFLF